MDKNDLTALTMIGVGGIGTALLPALSRLPFQNITLWDDDHVSTDNLINQFFWSDEVVGESKALMGARFLGHSGKTVRGVINRFEGNKPLFDTVVIAAVDSMESRRAIWRGVKDSRGGTRLFIDGRLSRETPYFFQLFAIPVDDPEAREFYESWLEGDGEPDSGRRDPDMIAAPLVLSGHIAMVIMRWGRGERQPRLTIWDGVGMSLMSFD